MAKNRIILLESNEHTAASFAGLLYERPEIKVVTTVQEAIKEINKGDVIRFRTNYIHDGLPSPEAILYARDALELAVDKDVQAEIWSSNSPKEIQVAIMLFNPSLDGKISIYERHLDTETYFTEKELPLVRATTNQEGGMMSQHLL